MYDVISDEIDLECKPTDLYGIEPIGVGTPFVESLSGYIQRLASAHMVKLPTLMKYVIIDKYLQEADRLGKHNAIVKNIDGTGLYSAAMVNTLENLTGQCNLKLLTMQAFTGLFSDYQLTNSNQGYCPYCLQEQKETSNQPYIQLLWCILPFRYCVIHGVSLNMPCSTCGFKFPQWTESSPAIGYCCSCKSWLGLPASGTKSVNFNDSTFSDFPIRLLARIEDFAEFPPPATFPSMLKYLIGNKMKVKENSAIARLIKQSKFTVDSWMSGQQLPTMKSVLSLSKCFNLDPMDIIFTSGADMETRDQKIMATIDKYEEQIQTVDWTKLHGLLCDVANSKASAMRIEDIARVYKCTPYQITEKYPELSMSVENRFNKMMRNKVNSQGDVTLAGRVESIVNQFISNGVRPTKTLVKDIVGLNGLWILPLIFYKYNSLKYKMT